MRVAILRTLTNSSTPITAHRIATSNSLDPATTYREVAMLRNIGVVEAVPWKRKQKAYRLAEGEVGQALRQLIQVLEAPLLGGKALIIEVRGRQLKKSARAREIAREMLREAPSTKLVDIDSILRGRTEGELASIVRMAKKGFEANFTQIGEREYLMRL